MTTKKWRVGIVGLQAGRSWAAIAHLPALRALSDSFEISGVANSHRASSETAARECGIPQAFDDASALVAAPDIDIVVVAVKVPQHLELVTQALDAGKHVYCEWPLGNGLREAEHLAELARRKGVIGVTGTQARLAPRIRYARHLLDEGHIGHVVSSTLTAWGGGWGATASSPELYAYLLDRRNGATMLTIPFAHTLAAVRDVLGDIDQLSATLANRYPSVGVEGSQETLAKTADDQILLNATLSSGAPLSIHYRGGMPRQGHGLIWEINGTHGDLRLTAANGHAQMVNLTLEHSDPRTSDWTPVDLPNAYFEGQSDEAMVGNVGRVYARMAADLDNGTRLAPDFDDAVHLHRLLTAIETSAEEGLRIRPDAPNRPLAPLT